MIISESSEGGLKVRRRAEASTSEADPAQRDVERLLSRCALEQLRGRMVLESNLGDVGGPDVCSTLEDTATKCVRDALSELSGAASAELVLGEVAGGKLTKGIIKKAIESQLSSVRSCYVAAQLVWPDASGRVRIQFDVGPSGRVLSHRIESDSTGHPDLACCISSAVAEFRFPGAPECGVTVVSYPFVLTSNW